MMGNVDAEGGEIVGQLDGRVSQEQDFVLSCASCAHRNVHQVCLTPPQGAVTEIAKAGLEETSMERRRFPRFRSRTP